MMSYQLKLNGCGASKNQKYVRYLFFTLLTSLNLHGRTMTEFEFFPYGFTISMILEESHATMHTWPEREEVQIDIFHCGKLAENFFDELIEHIAYLFSPKVVLAVVTDRFTMEVMETHSIGI